MSKIYTEIESNSYSVLGNIQIDKKAVIPKKLQSTETYGNLYGDFALDPISEKLIVSDGTTFLSVGSAGSGTGTLLTIAGGTGIDGGTVTSGNANFTIKNTGVVSGSYTNTSLSVNDQGMIDSAATLLGSGGIRGLTVVGPLIISNPLGVLFLEGGINPTGTIGITNSGVIAGNYQSGQSIGINKYGLITGITNGPTAGTVTTIFLGQGLTTNTTSNAVRDNESIQLVQYGTNGIYINPSLQTNNLGLVTSISSGIPTTGTVTEVLVSQGLTLIVGPIGISGGYTGRIDVADIITSGTAINPTITVNQKGQITNISSGNTGTVISVGTTNGLLGGATISGTFYQSNTTVTPGIYTMATFDVDRYGRITTIQSSQDLLGSVTYVGTIGGVTGGGTFGDLKLQLQDSGVVPGSYTNPTLSVDAKGRITSITNGSVAGSVNAVFGVNGIATTLIGNTLSIGLDVKGGVTITYSRANITVDQKGLITSGASGLWNNIQGISLGSGLTGTLSSGIQNLLLTDTGVVSGTYTNPYFHLDNSGRIVGITGGTIGNGNIRTLSFKDGLTGATITGSGYVGLEELGTSGTYFIPTLNLNNKGMVTSISSTGITTSSFNNINLVVKQVAHGLVVNKGVYKDSDGVWKYALVDSVHAIADGLITNVIDSDTFVVSSNGVIGCASGNLYDQRLYNGGGFGFGPLFNQRDLTILTGGPNGNIDIKPMNHFVLKRSLNLSATPPVYTIEKTGGNPVNSSDFLSRGDPFSVSPEMIRMINSSSTVDHTGFGNAVGLFHNFSSISVYLTPISTPSSVISNSFIVFGSGQTGILAGVEPEPITSATFRSAFAWTISVNETKRMILPYRFAGSWGYGIFSTNFSGRAILSSSIDDSTTFTGDMSGFILGGSMELLFNDLA